MNEWVYYRSESGDPYKIPIDQAPKEIAAYRKAVEQGDEKTMLHYEEGWTGWEFIDGAERI